MPARRLLLLGAALLSGLRLSATTVEPPDIDSLIAQSDYVVRAVVKSATPQWGEGAGQRYISTLVELDVREVLKGAPPSPLKINMLGGRIGETELLVTGMPVLHAGEEYVLFVHGDQRRILPLVAMMHGLYPVLREAKTGEEYVLRSDGRPLYSAQEVALPVDRASAVPRQNPAARPMTAKAFAQEIRQRVAIAAERNFHEK